MVLTDVVSVRGTPPVMPSKSVTPVKETDGVPVWLTVSVCDGVFDTLDDCVRDAVVVTLGVWVLLGVAVEEAV